MNGPEHYKKAQRLVAKATDPTRRHLRQEQAEAMAAAQVHATLALAAAQVEHAYNADGTKGVRTDWTEAIS